MLSEINHEQRAQLNAINTFCEEIIDNTDSEEFNRFQCKEIAIKIRKVN